MASLYLCPENWSKVRWKSYEIICLVQDNSTQDHLGHAEKGAVIFKEIGATEEKLSGDYWDNKKGPECKIPPIGGSIL